MKNLNIVLVVMLFLSMTFAGCDFIGSKYQEIRKAIGWIEKDEASEEYVDSEDYFDDEDYFVNEDYIVDEEKIEEEVYVEEEIEEKEENETGQVTCGPNITWEISSDGTLTISGSGEMNDFNFSVVDKSVVSNIPWIENRKEITKIIINDGVTSIGEYTFAGCSNVKSISIPNSVTSIGKNAFLRCRSLSSIIIDAKHPHFSLKNDILFNKTQTALIYCLPSKKGNLNIESTVTTILDGAFDGCNLTSIIVYEKNPNYSSHDGVLYDKKKTFLIGCPKEKGGTLIIPPTLTHIKSNILRFPKIIAIRLPSTVTEIDEDAFKLCKSLRIINIDEKNPHYSSKDGALYDKKQKTLIYNPKEKK
jgi:hypothetical protein